MYTIIKKKHHHFQNGISIKIVYIVVNTKAELPVPRNQWAVGSRCYVLGDGGEAYMLNQERNWEEISFLSDENGELSGAVYSKSETDALLAQKINVVSGMGLSQNSYTNAEKTKLAELSKAEINFLTNTVAKNYLKLDTTVTSVSGLTVTYQEDGGICFNGTATEPIAFNVFFPTTVTDWAKTHLNQHMILSGCPSNGSASTYRLQFWRYNDAGNSIYDEGNEKEFVFSNSTKSFVVAILINEAYQCNNLTFYPMLRDASVTDNSYQPYTMTNAELTQSVLQLAQNPASLTTVQTEATS